MGSDHDDAAAGPAAVGGLGGLEWVYIPAQVMAGVGDRAELELRRMRDGGVALLAYTSLELLVVGCGERQPWIAIPVPELEQAQHSARFDLIAVNVLLPPEMRHTDAVHVGSGEVTAR
ncbi:MAG: SAV_915 family protein [Pseudonocardiaceae bacterium]